MTLACYQFYASSPAPQPSVLPDYLGYLVVAFAAGLAMAGVALFALHRRTA